MSLTYDQFIKKVGKTEFRKCLNNELTHWNFQYKIGLNEDCLPFKPTGSCNPGGLYFTTAEYINDFLDYGLNIAVIELCTDAEFYIDPEGIKFKTNKFIIKEILPQTEELCKLAIRQNANSLKHVQEQTNELCRMAIQQNIWALQYVQEQTDELCRLAVQQSGMVLEYVQKQTDELCKLAVQQNGLALKFVQEQTEELCRLAVQQNGMALLFVIVKEQNYEICSLAARQIDPRIFKRTN
jgi:hypothetical protein